MAGVISPYYINGIIDKIFRGDPSAISSLPTTLYFALLTEPPYIGYGQFLLFDASMEASYTGYARLAVARSLTGFLSTQGNTSASTGTSGTTRPNANQYFALCTNSSQVITHVALTEELTQYPEDNGVVCFWDLPRPMQLSNTTPGYYPCINAAALTIRMDD